MCGRFKRSEPWAEYYDYLGLSTPMPNSPPRYNIAPTNKVYVVRKAKGSDAPELVTLRWGLIPYWAKDAKFAAKNINARGETVDEKPSFREAFTRRPCLVLADGFYEWRKEGKGRQPYMITLAKGGPFVFAGLWEHWRAANENEESLETCTIITTDASDVLRGIHPRMPVMLKPEDHATWLNRDDLIARKRLLRPLPGELIAITRVSTRVNSIANDDAACMAPELTLL